MQAQRDSLPHRAMLHCAWAASHQTLAGMLLSKSPGQCCRACLCHGFICHHLFCASQ